MFPLTYRLDGLYACNIRLRFLTRLSGLERAISMEVVVRSFLCCSWSNAKAEANAWGNVVSEEVALSGRRVEGHIRKEGARACPKH